jgi:hypothetical protein
MRGALARHGGDVNEQAKSDAARLAAPTLTMAMSPAGLARRSNRMLRCFARPCAALALAVLLGVLAGCSSAGAGHDSSPSPSASASAVSITPSPATDWQQTKTYENKRFGFSFQYDPTRFRVKEVDQGPSGGFTACVLERRSTSNLTAFFVRLVAKPHYLSGANVDKQQLQRLATDYASQTEPQGSQLSNPHLIRIGDRLGLGYDGSAPPNSTIARPMHYRFYGLPGEICIYEIYLGAPRELWSAVWTNYAGIVASFRAD